MQEVEKKPERSLRKQPLRGLKGQEEADGLEQKRGREAPHPSDDEEVGGALPERSLSRAFPERRAPPASGVRSLSGARSLSGTLQRAGGQEESSEEAKKAGRREGANAE